MGGGAAGQRGLAAQDGDQIRQRGRAADLGTADELGLPHVTKRHDHSERGGRVGEGDHPRDVAQRPIEPQLATEGEALGAGGAQLAGRDEQTHRDGQVESGTAFPHPGRRKVRR